MRPAHALALMIAQVALADPATDARIFYGRGAHLAASGRTAEALDAFLASQAAARNPNTLLAVAQLYEALGYTEAAYGAFAELEGTGRPLVGQARAALSRLSPRVAPVVLRSQPVGAEVYVERESAGRLCRTPCRAALPPGRHRLRVRLEGWRSADVEIEPRRGRTIEVDVSLVAVTGRLRVEAGGAAATVRVTGPAQATAPAPADLSLPPGRYDIEIGGDGLAPIRREAVVWADRVTQLAVELPRTVGAGARLLLATGAREARVSIDGRPAGFAPLVLDVEPGLRRLRVVPRSGPPWEAAVEFSAGEDVRIFASHAPGEARRPRLAPLVALGVGVVAASVGGWLRFREDSAVLGTGMLAASGVAFASAIGLWLDDRGRTSLPTQIERTRHTP